MSIEIRKKNFFIEKKLIESGKKLDNEYITAAIAITASNPYSSKYDENLSEIPKWVAQNANEFLSELMEHVNLSIEEVECYGKAAIIGINGELEHGAALLHPTLGTPMREFFDGTTVIHSTIKIGNPGCTIDVPVDHKTDKTSLDYSSNFEISIPNAPNADEFVLIMTIATGARPLTRKYENAVDLSAL